MSGIRKISSFKQKTSLERVPVLPIHEKYAERVQNDLDPFDDIIGRVAKVVTVHDDLLIHNEGLYK